MCVSLPYDFDLTNHNGEFHAHQCTCIKEMVIFGLNTIKTLYKSMSLSLEPTNHALHLNTESGMHLIECI